MSPVVTTLPTLSRVHLSLWCGCLLPSVAVGGEDDCSICCNIDDTVLCLDTHPAQLDVLRVCWAHLCVFLWHNIKDITRRYQLRVAQINGVKSTHKKSCSDSLILLIFLLSDILCKLVCAMCVSVCAYLQVVHQKFIEGRISIKVYQKTFIISNFNPRGLERNT